MLLKSIKLGNSEEIIQYSEIFLKSQFFFAESFQDLI